MSIEIEQPPLAPRIAELLSSLRLRIRSYVWTEGLAAVVVALGLAFWISLVFDWLFEPPWQFRAGMLVVVAAVIFYVIDRTILRRAFRRLDDTNLALVLERRFRDYRDSLVTSVELTGNSAHAAGFNRQMLDDTRRQAAERSQSIHLAEVFHFAPLLRTLGFAAALAVSVLALVVFAPTAFATWAQRVVLLDRDLLWPRSNHVRVQGFPENRTLKVAKGSDFEVTALADLTGGFQLPETVQVRYRTAEGTRGRDNMSTIGVAGPRDREQKYAYMFKGVMSSIGFDVYGGDDRDRDFHIEVVDNPTISHLELACKYPEYTGRPANTLPASGLVQLPMGTEVTISCEANKDLEQVVANMIVQDKVTPLADVQLATAADRRHFTLPMLELNDDTTLLFELHDADGIRSRDPVRLVLAARPDDIPVVGLRLRGISTAITAEARLPAVGEAHDDYGLSRLWFEYQLDRPKTSPRRSAATEQPAVGESAAADSPAALSPAEQPFRTSTVDRTGRPRTQVSVDIADGEALDMKRQADLGDLLRRRGVKSPDDLSSIVVRDEKSLVAGVTTQAQIDHALAFAPQIGDRISVTLKASDNCALKSGANVGQGERYQLDIVPPEQLLSMLEGRELMLRRQFEVTYQELIDTRDTLARLDFSSPDAKQPAGNEKGHEPGDETAPTSRQGGAEPGDQTKGEGAGPIDAKRALELRDLRVVRTLDNADRASHETLAVADSFDEIREEMSNNRIDTPELETRLKDQIADPLRRISVQMFPELRQRLTQLRRVLDDPTSGPEQLNLAVEQADAVLREMKLVLDKMLELETFNEVVDKLRDIIATQEKLNQQTLEKQKDEFKNKLRGLKD